jgi:hypothetical protein
MTALFISVMLVFGMLIISGWRWTFGMTAANEARFIGLEA